MNGLVDDLQRAVDLLDRTYAAYRSTLAMCANKFGPNVTFDATNATAALAVLDACSAIEACAKDVLAAARSMDERCPADLRGLVLTLLAAIEHADRMRDRASGAAKAG